MAEVYRAADTKLGRTVALKVILPQHASDPQFVERFLREARVVASLEHPGIVPVYDFGEEEGSVFLVMPFLDGGTLRDRMSGTPLAMHQVAAFTLQIAEALDAAHAAGVLHRDVKPENVLMGKRDRLALSDFGIAKLLEGETGLTATGCVVGTPVYMAPEQAQGRPSTPASDRYALAVLAYELLAGRPPFAGESALALMHQHVTAPVPALSTKVRGLPAGLDDLFRGALAKDPERRPATCRALADAISAFVPTSEHPPVAPLPISPQTAEMSAATVLQPVRPGTLVPLSRPRPSLTSAATAETKAARGRGRTLALAGIGLAVVAGALFAWSRTRPGPVAEERPAVASVPSPTPAPARLVATEATPPRVLEKREALGVEDLTEAALRLDPARTGRRATRVDFAAARAAAERVLAGEPGSVEARAVKAYAEAGLAYLDGRIEDAAHHLTGILGEAKGLLGGAPGWRSWFLERAVGKAEAMPEWVLALALGDPSRTAGPLLAKQVEKRPEDARLHLGLAFLARLDGKPEETKAEARIAYENAPGPALRAAAAELAGIAPEPGERPRLLRRPLLRRRGNEPERR